MPEGPSSDAVGSRVAAMSRDDLRGLDWVVVQPTASLISRARVVSVLQGDTSLLSKDEQLAVLEKFLL